MHSTLDSPYGFFDYYFNIKVYEDLEKFYEDYSSYGGVEHIDRKKHIFTYSEKRSLDYYHKRQSFTFKEFLCEFYVKEIILSNDLVDQNLQSIFSDKKVVATYIDFLRIKINSFKKTKAYKEFDFVQEIIFKLESHIDKFGIFGNTTTLVASNCSFSLIVKDSESQVDLIGRFYKMMAKEMHLIDSTPEEFENAFTGKEVTVGIKWLVRGKNKQISKVSLFYLIEELINNGFLSKSLFNDMNKHVKYVFRDNQGNEFKNLKQSKSTYSETVSSKEAINEIISSL